MAVSSITVTGTWVQPDGTQDPASGTVRFELNAPIIDSDGDQIVAAQSLEVSLDSNGAISVDLSATDEPGTEPAGNTYTVIEQINDAAKRSYKIEVPHDASNGTIDLADISPVSDSTVTYGLPKPDGWLNAVENDPIAADGARGTKLFRPGADQLGSTDAVGDWEGLPKDTFAVIVNHGNDETTARPAYAARVWWRGEAIPDNGSNGDVWDSGLGGSPPDVHLHSNGYWRRVGDGALVTKELLATFETDSDSQEVLLPLKNNVNVDIDWGDGSAIETVTSDDPTHVYADARVYNIEVVGSAVRYGDSSNDTRYIDRILWVDSFGRLSISDLESAFHNVSTDVGVPLLLPPGVGKMRNMLRGISSDPDVSQWDVSQAYDMRDIFINASNVDPDVSRWDTSSASNIARIFKNADSANPDVSRWDLPSLSNARGAFYSADIANPDVSRWDMSGVTAAERMFRRTNANPDVSKWIIGQLSDATDMFLKAALSNANYDALLVGWANQSPDLQDNVDFHAGDAKYTETAARDTLVNDHGWNITDGGPA